MALRARSASSRLHNGRRKKHPLRWLVVWHRGVRTKYTIRYRVFM